MISMLSNQLERSEADRGQDIASTGPVAHQFPPTTHLPWNFDIFSGRGGGWYEDRGDEGEGVML